VKDVQSFWQSFGISRADPVVIDVAEHPATRYLESTIDVEWYGALAPGAALRVYQGADTRNTSMLFAFNEAVGRGEVQVLTDSFAHREDSEARDVREQYDDFALMGAALGITITAASGDGGKPDVPSSSPYVTAIGGTYVELNADGSIALEQAWGGSGSGDTKSFAIPAWQTGVPLEGTTRATCDVSLDAALP